MFRLFVPNRMAERMKEEPDIKKMDLKEEIVSIQEEILPSLNVEETLLHIYMKKI